MKHRIIMVLLLLGVLLSPIAADTRFSFATDLNFGWTLAEDNKAKAMGVSFETNTRLGYDATKNITLFGEGGVILFGPTVYKSSFINVPRNVGVAVGAGAGFTFKGGFALSASGGFYYNKLDRTVEMYETGVYVTIKPRMLLFSMLPSGDFYNSAISLPVTVYWNGNGYQIRASVAVGIDCSAFGKRK